MRWSERLTGAACLLLLLPAGCDDTADDEPVVLWIEDPSKPLPEWIAETGIFDDVESQSASTRFVSYVPPYALWSDGAHKSRLLHLPGKEAIETSEAGWRFPVGTVLVKTFSFEGIEGREGDVPVETRIMVLREAGWDYGVYRWNADGDRARLEAGDWSARPFELLGADGSYFRYDVPGRIDCRACHETQGTTPVIGLSALNLDRQLPPSVFDEPATAAAFPDASPEAREAMGYLVANCVHCHHGRNVGVDDNAAFSLLPDDLVANTVGQPTESSASGVGVRVVPGDPEASALYEAVVEAPREGYAGDFKPMPPLGVLRPDPEAKRVLAAWINSL